jgi:glycosyltransferase involved in cell wall biosynthesis
MSLAIITTDSPGCREVAENNVNGLLVPLNDSAALAQAILRLVDEPDTRQRFGQISRRRAVAEFDSPTIAKRIQVQYDQLLKR